MKHCKECGLLKPKTDEHFRTRTDKRRKNLAYFYSICRECENRLNIDYAKNNPEIVSEIRHRYNRRKSYYKLREKFLNAEKTIEIYKKRVSA